jgi:hypothetical protein
MSPTIVDHGELSRGLKPIDFVRVAVNPSLDVADQTPCFARRRPISMGFRSHGKTSAAFPNPGRFCELFKLLSAHPVTVGKHRAMCAGGPLPIRAHNHRAGVWNPPTIRSQSEAAAIARNISPARRQETLRGGRVTTIRAELAIPIRMPLAVWTEGAGLSSANT